MSNSRPTSAPISIPTTTKRSPLSREDSNMGKAPDPYLSQSVESSITDSCLSRTEIKKCYPKHFFLSKKELNAEDKEMKKSQAASNEKKAFNHS